MNELRKSGIFFLVIFLMIGGMACAQAPINWTANQLMQPSELALKINAHEKLPVIISIGPGAIIPNSIDIGMISDGNNKDKFIQAISKLDKNSSIVIYCGCCPFDRCPNVRPAIEELKKRKFTNYKLLNLSTNIKTDWISKGYPTTD